MSDKYEDLADKISDVLEPGLAGYAYIRNALRWLDTNPEQVPGRTITESEFHEVADAHRNGGLGWRDLADSLGITVVPDPEPTNAEKWEAFILGEIRGNSQWDASTIATAIDRHGVKAPGGDE